MINFSCAYHMTKHGSNSNSKAYKAPSLSSTRISATISSIKTSQTQQKDKGQDIPSSDNCFTTKSQTPLNQIKTSAATTVEKVKECQREKKVGLSGNVKGGRSKRRNEISKRVMLTGRHAKYSENGSFDTSELLPPQGLAKQRKDRWPFCIVWTPLPFVTWFIPLIGHTGLADSRGIIFDFSDDFVVSVDNFAFGRPTKYYQCDPKLAVGGAEGWDEAISAMVEKYSRTRHMACFNNCHHHIAGAFNYMNYDSISTWGQIEIWWLITWYSSYVDFPYGMLKQWWPFSLVVISVIIFLVLITH